MVHPSSGTLFRSKKNYWHIHMDESQYNYTRWEKPEGKKWVQTALFHLYRVLVNQSAVMQSRLVVTWGPDGRCLQGSNKQTADVTRELWRMIDMLIIMTVFQNLSKCSVKYIHLIWCKSWLFIYSFIYVCWYWRLNLHLLGRHSKTWATTPALIYISYFGDGLSHLSPGWSGLQSSYFMLPT
jgi:hypothetical protein